MSEVRPPILHFVPDDKYVDIAMRQFEEVYPGANRFVCLADGEVSTTSLPSSVDVLSTVDCLRLLSAGEYSGVCLHRLAASARVVRAIRPSVNVLWIGWGSDYYENTLLAGPTQHPLVLPGTARLLHLSRSGSLTLLAQHLNELLRLPTRWRNRKTRRMLERLDYFSPVLEPEATRLKELNPWFTPAYLPWNYGTVEDDLEPASALGVDAPNILVGNSASPSCNHVEVFEALAQRKDLVGRKIVVPLSYGNAEYADRLIAVGRSFFGDAFEPLSQFLPLQAYLDLLGTCGVAIMNHQRQQGLGNILTILLAGGRVFLDTRNPLFEWFSQQGVRIDSMNTLADEDDIFDPLGAELVKRNRQVIESHWSREVQERKTRSLVCQLIEPRSAT